MVNLTTGLSPIEVAWKAAHNGVANMSITFSACTPWNMDIMSQLTHITIESPEISVVALIIEECVVLVELLLLTLEHIITRVAEHPFTAFLAIIAKS